MRNPFALIHPQVTTLPDEVEGCRFPNCLYGRCAYSGGSCVYIIFEQVNHMLIELT